jgi:hypothetical protein
MRTGGAYGGGRRTADLFSANKTLSGCTSPCGTLTPANMMRTGAQAVLTHDRIFAFPEVVVTRDQKAKLVHHPWLHPRRLLVAMMLAALMGWMTHFVTMLLGVGNQVPWVFLAVGPMIAIQLLRFAMLHQGWAALGAKEIHNLLLEHPDCPVAFQAALVKRLREQTWLSWQEVEALGEAHGWTGDVHDGALRILRGGNPEGMRASVGDLEKVVLPQAWENGLLHAGLGEAMESERRKIRL